MCNYNGSGEAKNSIAVDRTRTYVIGWRSVCSAAINLFTDESLSRKETVSLACVRGKSTTLTMQHCGRYDTFGSSATRRQ